MPTPKKGEKKKDFIKRCIPHLYNEEPEALTSDDKKNKQAYAICINTFNKKKKKKNESIIFNFETFVNENKL